jgi:uncharacterized BrkB/YihY/UPF0761 family membrane protein
VRALATPILGIPLVADGLAASEWFGLRGGGLLAAGLAFRGLFAVLTALLFAVGLLGLLIADPELRARLLEAVLVLVPEPLQAPFTDIVTNLVEQRWTLSILGLLGLLWGASALYDSIEVSLAVLLPGGRRRGQLERRVRGLLILLGLVAVVTLPVLLTVVLPQLERHAEPPDAVRLVVGTCGALLAVVGLIGAAYRWAPARAPRWPELLPAAIIAGLAIWALTALFGVIAPFLVKGYAAFGVFVSFLAALLWLNLVATAFLLGAAWVRVRRDGRRAAISAEDEEESPAGRP